MELAAKLGKRLKMIRIAAGIKQKDLSVELNIPAPLLSMYEKGTREPSLAFLNKFSEFFKLPLSQLFTLMEDVTPTRNNSEVSLLMNEMKNLITSLERETLKIR